MPLKYKGFELKASPEKLKDQDRWTVRVLITRHNNGDTREKFCFLPEPVDSLRYAEAQAIEFGQRVVDGEVPGCAVDDLIERP